MWRYAVLKKQIDRGRLDGRCRNYRVNVAEVCTALTQLEDAGIFPRGYAVARELVSRVTDVARTKRAKPRAGNLVIYHCLDLQDPANSDAKEWYDTCVEIRRIGYGAPQLPNWQTALRNLSALLKHPFPLTDITFDAPASPFTTPDLYGKKRGRPVKTPTSDATAIEDGSQGELLAALEDNQGCSVAVKLRDGGFGRGRIRCQNGVLMVDCSKDSSPSASSSSSAFEMTPLSEDSMVSV